MANHGKHNNNHCKLFNLVQFDNLLLQAKSHGNDFPQIQWSIRLYFLSQRNQRPIFDFIKFDHDCTFFSSITLHQSQQFVRYLQLARYFLYSRSSSCILESDCSKNLELTVIRSAENLLCLLEFHKSKYIKSALNFLLKFENYGKCRNLSKIRNTQTGGIFNSYSFQKYRI